MLLAERYDVPIEVPAWFRSLPDRAYRVTDPSLEGFSFLPVTQNVLWQETALWNRETLITGDAVSTSDWIGPEQVSLYPYLWFRPPAWMEGLDPARVICGHGDPLEDPCLRFDLGPTQYPEACYRIARMFIRGL